MQTIPLTQGRVAVVDDDDYAELAQYNWHYKNGYAARAIGPAGKQVRLWMQNVIMGVSGGVDHIDRDKLNNRRSNLRLASKSLQGHNRSMPKRDLPRGVYWHRRHGCYTAAIRVNHKLRNLGRFDTPEEAKAVYDAACMEVHGELAPEST